MVETETNGRKAMKKQNKYTYLHVLQGNYGYGHGWEDLTASEDYRDVKRNLKEYRESEGGNYDKGNRTPGSFGGPR